MDDYRGILNLVFWFLIYWFVFRKRKKKPAAPKKQRDQSPAAAPARSAQRSAQSPRTTMEQRAGRSAAPPDEPAGETGGKVPPSVWEDLRKMLEGDPTGAGRDETVPETATEPPNIPGYAEAQLPQAREIAAEQKSTPLPVRKRRGPGRGPRRGRSCRFPELADRSGLRRALVLAEVLAPPVSIRRRRGMRRLV